VKTFQRSFPQDPGKFCTPFCSNNNKFSGLAGERSGKHITQVASDLGIKTNSEVYPGRQEQSPPKRRYSKLD